MTEMEEVSALDKVFVVAMDCEAEAVTAHFDSIDEDVVCGRRILHGEIDGEKTAVVVSGVGKCNAAAATMLVLCWFDPKVILNVGVAGALRAPMKVAEVYRVRAAVQYDFDLAQINGTKVGTLNEYRKREIALDLFGNSLPVALLATGDRFNDSADDHAFITDDVKADLRDMEGAAIAHVAKRAGVPCRAIKSVSDVYGSGSTTEQYLANLKAALASLSRSVPAFFATA